MRVYLGSDHAGFEVKGKLVEYLTEQGIEAIDVGAPTYDALDDYPAWCIETARRVVEDPESLGIVQDPVKQGPSLAALQNRKEGKPPRVATVQVDFVFDHRKVAFFEIGNESFQGVADTLGGGDSSGHREKPDEAWSELGGIALGGGEVVLAPSIV